MTFACQGFPWSSERRPGNGERFERGGTFLGFPVEKKELRGVDVNMLLPYEARKTLVVVSGSKSEHVSSSANRGSQVTILSNLRCAKAARRNDTSVCQSEE